MANDIEFVGGLHIKPPHEKAPTFVKASISIKVADLTKWIATKAGEEWVNVDVKESKGGKWYASVSTYKPKEKSQEAQAPARKGRFDDMKDDEPLPF